MLPVSDSEWDGDPKDPNDVVQTDPTDLQIGEPVIVPEDESEPLVVTEVEATLDSDVIGHLKREVEQDDYQYTVTLENGSSIGYNPDTVVADTPETIWDDSTFDAPDDLDSDSADGADDDIRIKSVGPSLSTDIVEINDSKDVKVRGGPMEDLEATVGELEEFRELAETDREKAVYDECIRKLTEILVTYDPDGDV